jgi:hypothetical protein
MSNADTLAEFVKSFSDGYFGLRIGDNIFPAKLAERPNTARENLALSYIPANGKQPLSRDINWQTERDMLIRGYPDLGCIKVSQTVGYLKTRPARQFKKGYVTANVELFVPNATEIKKSFPRFVASASSKSVVWQIFNREYWTPAEAVRLMDAGEGAGYPLSPHFGLYMRADTPNLLILHKNKDVGVYRDGRFELFDKFDLLKEQFTRETKTEVHVCPH